MRQDLRFALRSLLRYPVFTLSAIATLGLGIGVNTTIFSLANAAFFRPMHGLATPASLTWVSAVSRERMRPGELSYPEYLHYREQTTAGFSSLMAYAPTSFSLGSGGEPQRVRGHLASGDYFATLGTMPAAGRLLQQADDQPGSAPAAVIGYQLWRQRFRGSTTVLGTPIAINGRSFTIVGVTPEGFTGPELGQPADLWLPIAAWPRLNEADASRLEARDVQWLRVVGRLRSGTTQQQAQALVTTAATDLARTDPVRATRTAVLSSAAAGIAPGDRGEIVPVAALLLTVTGLVLLIACANVANLLLARGAGRSMELAVRAAIGASRGRLVRQLLTESLVLAGAGAAAGMLLFAWTSDLLQTQIADSDFRGLPAAVDVRVLLVTAALAGLSVCVFGLVPALSVTRVPRFAWLRDTTSAGGTRSRLQNVFVVTQLSLSLVLLLAAGLSLRALQKAGTIDLGFDPHQVVTAAYDLSLQNYPADRREAFRRELLAHTAALPGIASATIANVAPLSGTMINTSISTADAGPTTELRAFVNAIGPGYFATLAIPLVRGRGIDVRDGRGAAGAAVVNETMARQVWPGIDPIGRRLRLEGERDALEIVGVARDSKYDEPTEDPRPFVYLSLAQYSMLDRETVIVRTSDAPARAAATLRDAMRALDPALPIFDLRSFETILQERADKQRGLSRLFAAFGVIAAGLAALGLYGVMTHAVTVRTREMGVRLALGASPAQITRLVVGDGLRLALIGVAIGGALTVPLAAVLGALIFGIGIADLATFAATCALLMTVALAAALLPARRASRLDPIAALRTE